MNTNRIDEIRERFSEQADDYQLRVRAIEAAERQAAALEQIAAILDRLYDRIDMHWNLG